MVIIMPIVYLIYFIASQQQNQNQLFKLEKDVTDKQRKDEVKDKQY